MRILDRYIFKPVIQTFIGCLFIFIFLYIISDTLAHLDEILKNRIGLSAVYRYYLTYLPIIFTQTSPIALLLAAIYTFGRLNRNNELIAMRSSGLSLWQISAPLLVIGLALSMGVFFVNERLVPQAQAQAEKMKGYFSRQGGIPQNAGEGDKKTGHKEETINNLAFYGLKNRLFFVHSFDSKDNIMKGITILEHDEEQNLIAKIVAREGRYKDNLWIFYEFTKFQFDRYGHISADTTYSQEQIMDITESPEDLLQQSKRPELMNVGQLEDYIWRLKKSGAAQPARSLLVDLYQRYASSASSLILILIGIPFSFMIRKRANLFSSFGICILISFLYYIFTAISLALGKAGVILPSLAVWLIPLAFSLWALNAISKAS